MGEYNSPSGILRVATTSETCLIGVVEEVDVAQRCREVDGGCHTAVLIHVPYSPVICRVARSREAETVRSANNGK